MKCKLCGSNKVKIIYNGLIRDGGLGKYTSKDIPVYQCEDCSVIWHEKEVIDDIKKYYESKEYRNSLEGSSQEEEFYRLHDKENLDKFKYTGTEIFRHKKVADIGCGCGAFLDFLKGVADTIIAIEPSETYRNIMDRKGYKTYAYAENAIKDFREKVDVVTSFDVIEHVENPVMFLQDVYDLLKVGGKAVIGTPTDAPVMRMLLGELYEKKLLFSTQHLWIFSERNLKSMSENIGFSNIDVKYFQRYGIGNMLGWLKDREPRTEGNIPFPADTISEVWKKQCEAYKASDYIVLYVTK